MSRVETMVARSWPLAVFALAACGGGGGAAVDGAAVDGELADAQVPDAGQAPRRPNIILLLTDDQRWDAWSHGQSDPDTSGRLPWLIGTTPHMDRLALEGIHFSNAFAVSALCSPSRAAFLTGRYNHLNGVANNATPLALNTVTFAGELRDEGWRTGYFGKWHMGTQSERPGFEEVASFIGQGGYFDATFLVNGSSVTTTGWVDDVTTDFALDFIERNQSERFAMVVGFKSPHAPQTPPARLDGLFPTIQNILSPSRTAYAPFDPTPVVTVPTNAILQRYSRCVVGADENIGRVLAKLDELGLADDTVVVFASDNGYMLGDHSLADKRVAYEESIRIPLVLRYPRLGMAGTHVTGIVLNIDLAPTLLALAGVAAPGEMQGGSWLPLLDGSETRLRDEFLYEYFAEEKDFEVPTIVGLRRETDKLVTYPDNPAWDQLFDVAADANEITNLAPLPAHAARLAELRARLDAQKASTHYQVPSKK